jgi:hypothetical protein
MFNVNLQRHGREPDSWWIHFRIGTKGGGWVKFSGLTNKKTYKERKKDKGHLT